MSATETKSELDKLLERIRDPIQLRIAITTIMIVIGYLAVYMPLNDGVESTARTLRTDQRREALASDIQQLQDELERIQTRIPTETDTNEWVQYVIDGIRHFPLKLTSLDPGDSQRIGPYEAVVLHVVITGNSEGLDSFLHWLEANQRFFRADTVKIEPSQCEAGALEMQLTLLGAKA